MRREAHDLLAEMAAKKPHTQFDRRQRVQTETRRRDKDKLEGLKILDPSEVIPKYLENEEVQATEKRLIEAATNGEIPTDAEFKAWTNSLLLRLNIKNGNSIHVYFGL